MVRYSVSRTCYAKWLARCASLLMSFLFETTMVNSLAKELLRYIVPALACLCCLLEEGGLNSGTRIYL